MIVDQSTEQINAALLYARLGWAVVPLHTPTNGVCSCSKGKDCTSPGKHPRTVSGLKDASTDPTTIRQWWERWPSANIGICTGGASGLVVVDVDGDCEMPTAMQNLPRTITATTGRGRHLYFRVPDRAIGNRTKIGGLPIDLRGDGGYVVGPPSVHVGGAVYEWHVGPDDCELADMPADLLEWLMTPATASSARQPMTVTATGGDLMSRARAYMQRCDPAIQGSGGSGTLMRVLRLLRATFDLSPDDYLTLAREYSDRCVPPWSEAELSRAISNIEARPSERRPEMDGPRQPSNGSNTPADAMNDGDIDGEQESTRNASDNKHNATDVKHLTDLGNAKRMVADHGKIIRYCFAWGKWLVWDGRRWKIDDTGYVMLLAKRTIMGLYGWAEAQLKLLANDDSPEAKLMAAKVKAVLDFAIKSEHVNRLKAMVALASSEPNIPITPGDLDRNSLAFNCENGTLFLRTLELKPHNQTDYITKLCHTRYVRSAKCPIFEKTIDGIFKKDAEVIQYVSRFTGYCLSGETREHVVPIAYGGGSNGKSLLLNLIIDCMGSDYAGTVPPELLMEAAGNQHPTIKADLFGKRFMVAMETAEGARLNEQRIKALSGGDRIKARRCKEDFWEFDPTHKLLLCTNHKPTVQGDDHGIWRRLALLPFVATYWDSDKGETGDAEFKADKALPEKLRGEMEGILAWMVRGFEEWHRHGLPAPEAVRTATKEYRSDEDRISAFLEECCTRIADQTVRTKTGELYAAYKRWSEQNGERWCTTNAFTRALAERGITRDTGRRWYECVSLAKPSETPQPSEPSNKQQASDSEPE